MFTMQEALARDHMRQRERCAQRQSLATEVAAAHRWRAVERATHAAYRRSAQRARRADQSWAVAR